MSACDAFFNTFEQRGLRAEVLCPCAYSPETLTIAIRRPGRADTGSSGRGILSLTGLSHGVVRVDKEGSLTALILQDCGLVVPGGNLIMNIFNVIVKCEFKFFSRYQKLLRFTFIIWMVSSKS